MRLFFDHAELGNVAQAGACVLACERLAEDLRRPLYRGYVLLLCAARATQEGRWQEADRLEADARAHLSRAEDTNLALPLDLHAFGKALMRGADVGDAVRSVQRLIGLVGEDAWALVAATRDAQRGDLSAANAVLRSIPHDSNAVRFEPIFMQLLTYLRLLTGYHEGAELLLDTVEARRDRFVSGGISGMLIGPPYVWLSACLKSVLHRHDEAARDFEQAIAMCEKIGARGALAQVRRDQERAGRAPARGLGVRFSLEREGDTWTVRRGGRVFRLKDSRGLQILAQLVAEPGREMHVLTLGAGGDPGDLGDAGDVLDPQAARAYRSRLEDLRDTEREAEAQSDLGRAEKARAEIEAIAQQIAGAMGMGARGRKAASVAERARTNVQRRLKDAIKRIEENDPELGKYLGWTVRTGIFCVFQP
jgi:tetratricopeptide (TPR) repeat protein